MTIFQPIFHVILDKYNYLLVIGLIINKCNCINLLKFLYKDTEFM